MLTITQLKSLADKISYISRNVSQVLGSSTAAPFYSAYAVAQSMLNLSVVDSNDYDTQYYLNAPLKTFLGSLDSESDVSLLRSSLYAVMYQIQQYMLDEGSSVEPSITSIREFLDYYNGGIGSGTVKYQHQIPQQFADLYLASTGDSLTNYTVFADSLHSFLNANYQNGMGARQVGSSFVSGTAIPETYSPANLYLEVATTFLGGTGLPTVTVAGVDEDGATSTTWSVTLDANNPTMSISPSLTSDITAEGRQTVELTSTSHIVPGSILIIGSGTLLQENIVVESVSSPNITALFTKTHDMSETILGLRSYALTPSVAGKRCRSVSGITLGLTGHTAGRVRVINQQPRGII